MESGSHILHVLMMHGDDVIMSLLDRKLYVCLHIAPIVGKDGDDVLRILIEKASVSNMLVCEVIDTLEKDMTVQNWIKKLQSQVNNIPLLLVRSGCNLARVLNCTSNTCRYTRIGHMQYAVENTNINPDRQMNNLRTTTVVAKSDQVNDVVANKANDVSITSPNECVTKRKNSCDNNTQVDMGCGLNRTKRQRVVWTPELRKAFDDAVHELGFENAVPKKILEVMKWTGTGLTRENVASHLQKYRACMKSQHNTIPTQQNESTSRRRNKSTTNPPNNNNTMTTTDPNQLHKLPEQVTLQTPQLNNNNNIHRSDPISSCPLDNNNMNDDYIDQISPFFWWDETLSELRNYKIENSYEVASGMYWLNNNVCLNVGNYQDKYVPGIESYSNVGNNVAQNGEECRRGSYTSIPSISNHDN